MSNLMALVRAAVVALTLMACALPATASARPGRAAEPVVVVPGLGQNCVTARYDAADNPVLAGAVAGGLRNAHAATGGAVDAVPESSVYGWRFSACWRKLSTLAVQLDQYLAKIQAQHGGSPVDLVSFSFGGAIVRYCLTNPLGATPKCRARVDDWAGIVNATNGSTKADLPACLTAGLVGLGSICSSLSYQSLDIKRMNRRDPSPGDVEYTMFWTPQDEFLLPTGTSVLEGARNVVLRSKLGRVTHTGTWLGGPCTTTADWVGIELLDATEHVVGADRFDCNTTLTGEIIPPPPPPNAPAAPAAGPGAPSDLDAASAVEAARRR
ncbi:MAG: hypothetical protein JHD16_07120 [Solirubrobacteraceae bacterium]|nr:hypothetical protein [Solirubrobacteraceae bacterium]